MGLSEKAVERANRVFVPVVPTNDHEVSPTALTPSEGLGNRRYHRERYLCPVQRGADILMHARFADYHKYLKLVKHLALYDGN